MRWIAKPRAWKLLLVCLVLCSPYSIAQKNGSEPAIVDGPVHDGVEIIVDLPGDQHVKNFGAPSDGAGLCVFASMDMAARWHHMPELIDIIHKLKQGGGWPEKVAKVLKEHAPNRKYVQYEGTSPDLMDAAMAARSPACVTYGYGERYNGQTIAHMVILVHLDAKWACIIDNNFPGEQNFEWMSRKEFLRRWQHPTGKGWCYVFMESPPPPIPRSEARP